jgi:hypothetical protein
MVEQQNPEHCDHCGNLSYWSEKATLFRSVEEFPGSGYDIGYHLYQCTICNQPILQETFQRGGEVQGSRQLWPPPLRLSPAAPQRVRQIYQEARSVMRRSPSSYVVQIGRALEAITNDKGAQGNSLYQKLDWLVTEGHLPQVFGEMTHVTRILRNWGAHDAEVDVEPEDVDVVDEFFKAIVEYLYVAPARVRRVQDLIEQRKKADF